MIDGSAWVYARKEFIADIRDDLQLIDDYFSVPRTLYRSSSYPNFPSGNDSQFYDKPPIKKDSWQNNFKCQKEIWATLISNWEGIKRGYYKGEEYQPFAKLFEKFNQYDLAAYFYQVSDGIVDKDLYYKVANQQNSSSPVVFGLEIKPKKNLIDHVLDFITLEIDMKIRFVVPLSLLILVSGWFIGTKTWESYTSATEIEKSLCSKTFNKDDKNCPVIVLEPETSYNFNEIKRVIPAVVNDAVDEKKREEYIKYQKANQEYKNKMSQRKPATPPQEKTEENIKQEVIGNLVSILKNTALKYEDLSPGKEPTDLKTQKQWVTAIYNYQVKKDVKYQKIAGNGNENNQCNPQIFGRCLWPFGQSDAPNDVTDVKNSNLYKELKKDILAAMKPQQSRGINSPSQSSSRLKPTGNLKTVSKNQTPPSTPKTPEDKSPNPQTDDIRLENPGN
jgi:hypothetical protein